MGIYSVGLIDVDSHNFPNLPLMKISAWEKKQGNQVEFANCFLHYDRVYMARVFDDTYSEDCRYVLNAEEVIKGGTGYNNNVLPDEIEHIYPDYELYGEKRAIGFLTRGCPRHCPFCIVGDKEGLKSHQVAELGEFYRGGEDGIVLLDPNITASEECDKLLEQLLKTKTVIEFNQGIDIRFMTKERVRIINQIETPMLHMAWDNYEFNTYKILKDLRPYFTINPRKLTVYVLVNFNTTIEQDLERIYKLRELDYTPFVMIYNKPKAPKIIKSLARWVNNRFVFRTTERFEDYDVSYHNEQKSLERTSLFN